VIAGWQFARTVHAALRRDGRVLVEAGDRHLRVVREELRVLVPQPGREVIDFSREVGRMGSRGVHEILQGFVEGLEGGSGVFDPFTVLGIWNDGRGTWATLLNLYDCPIVAREQATFNGTRAIMASAHINWGAELFLREEKA